MRALSSAEITERLAGVPMWQTGNGTVWRVFSFPDFVAAMQFVNKVADAAEAAGHHPDIDIRYNKVTLALSTHDAGGITEKDFELANRIDQLT